MTKQNNMYITGTDSFKSYAAQSDTDIVTDPIQRNQVAKTIGGRTFDNWSTHISVKSDYNRGDYERFRPSHTMPKTQQDIIRSCMEAYQKVGLVRNVIDLMGDFGAQGIRLQHSVPSTQAFYNSWWEKIGGTQISERFLNLLYRAGQTIIRSSYGRVGINDEKKWRKSQGQDIKLEKLETVKREIPLKYIFTDPLSVDILSPDLVPFVGKPILVLKISTSLKAAIARAKAGGSNIAPEITKMIDKIPTDILNAISKGQRYIPLDPKKTSIHYYKKDDWMLWANPMVYSILDDLIMLNNLKLADISALDGAISNIRLWKLGIIGDSPANSILPTRSAINKLRSILANNVGGGVLDLVWGPELSFEESNSQVWRFLGSEKYTVTINAIYEGLGIPATLRTGSSTTNTGSFIGLNTLVKRLQYGRDRLIEFWIKELKTVHKAMDFPGRPPDIVFDFMALADEAAEKQLLINLWDRDIISDETILELFGRLPHIEKSRVNREVELRSKNNMPHKASPYHNPNYEQEYKKILLQGGGVAPSEIGLDLQDRKADEQSYIDKTHKQDIEMLDKEIKNEIKMQEKQNEFEAPFKQQETDNKILLQKDQQKFKQGMMKQQQKQKKTGVSGRPKNVIETKKRKSKPSEKPSTKASFMNLFMWANVAQEEIAELTTKAFLAALNKPNIRSLSREEFDLVEKIKFNILCNFDPFEPITPETIHEFLEHKVQADKTIKDFVSDLKNQFVSQNSRNPTVSEMRQIYSSSYALYYEENE